MTEDQLRRIEERLTAMERRLEYLEYRSGIPSQAWSQPPAPPVVRAPDHTQPRPPMQAMAERIAQPRSEPSDPKPNRPANQAEYLIGTQILPRIGAAFVLLGVLFFVVWGYNSGWITPTVVFTLEVLFCLSFVAVGLAKRDLRADFGQVLIGIGSCGLYITFAGGHLFHKLYGGEALVALFVALSLANLGYATIRESRAFHAIGLIGGLVAAALPVEKGSYVLSVVLHFLILVPAALIAARYRWSESSIALWLLSFAALLPLLDSDAPWQLQIAAWYCSSLVCSLAFAHSAIEDRADISGYFAAGMVFVTGLVGYALQHQPIGAIHLLIFGGAAALIGAVAPKNEIERQRWIAGAVLVPFVLGPLCFQLDLSMVIFIGLATLSALASNWLPAKPVAALAIVELALGLTTYIVRTLASTPFLPNHEIGILFASILAVGLIAHVYVRAGGNSEDFVTGSLVFAAPLFGRLAVVGLDDRANASTAESMTIALTILCFAAIVIAARTRWRSATALAAILGACAFVAFWSMALYGTSATFELTMAALLIFAAIGTAHGEQVRSQAHGSSQLKAAVSLVVGVLLLRIGSVVATVPAIGATAEEGIVYTTAICILVTSRLSFRPRFERTALVASALLAFALFVHFANSQFVTGSAPLVPLSRLFAEASALMISLGVLVLTGLRLGANRDGVLYLGSIVGWVLTSRWWTLGIELLGTDLPYSAAISLGWTVYATALIWIGFAKDASQLRYAGIGVFCLTIGKVLLFDLAGSDPGVRVAVTMALGLAMLGGGYWYVRVRQAQAPS